MAPDAATLSAGNEFPRRLCRRRRARRQRQARRFRGGGGVDCGRVRSSGAPSVSDLKTFGIVGLVVAVVVASSGTDGAQDLAAIGIPNEVHQMLGDGVVGAAEPVGALSDPLRVAHWQPGEWTYRITAGERGGQTERE